MQRFPYGLQCPNNFHLANHASRIPVKSVYIYIEDIYIYIQMCQSHKSMLPISSNRTVGCVISMASSHPKKPRKKTSTLWKNPWLLAMVSKIFSQFLMILIASSVGLVLVSKWQVETRTHKQDQIQDQYLKQIYIYIYIYHIETW